MHLLVVNDDGPPSPFSPYVETLVRELEAAGHLVSVALPASQQSWIGKAHRVTQEIRCVSSKVPGQEGWMLIDGTPAACAHLGLKHLFRDRPAVDLVVSGPNLGRNVTTVFALSSGTIGAAMEATLCGTRAVALSYSVPSQPMEQISAPLTAAVRHSIKIMDSLVRKWPADGSVHLYSVNMPLEEDIAQRRVVWCGLTDNQWDDACVFSEGPVQADGSRNFSWAPQLDRVEKQMAEAPEGTDGWATHHNFTRYDALLLAMSKNVQTNKTV